MFLAFFYLKFSQETQDLYSVLIERNFNFIFKCQAEITEFMSLFLLLLLGPPSGAVGDTSHTRLRSTLLYRDALASPMVTIVPRGPDSE